jgi:hypothetical protein
MGNFQYIADRLPPTGREQSPKKQEQSPKSTLLRQYLFAAESLAMGYAFGQNTVLSLISIHLPLALRSPRVIAAIVACVAAAAGIATYALTRRKPTPEEVERERRDLLARSGRITDGTIMDTMITEARNSSVGAPDVSAPDVNVPDLGVAEMPLPGGNSVPTPQIIVYNYRIAGVTYECAQDVTTLAEYVHGIRTDLPIQVRYLPQNPANSIVVAESWSGLRLGYSHPHHAD